MCRDSRGHTIDPATPFHCTPPHCVCVPTSAGLHGPRGSLNGNECRNNLNSVCRVRGNQRIGLGPDRPGCRKDSRAAVNQHGGLGPRHTECWQNSRRWRDNTTQMCVDRENRSYFNRRGAYNSKKGKCLAQTKIMIFDFAMLPRSLRIRLLEFVGPEIMNLNLVGGLANLERQIASARSPWLEISRCRG